MTSGSDLDSEKSVLEIDEFIDLAKDASKMSDAEKDTEKEKDEVVLVEESPTQ